MTGGHLLPGLSNSSVEDGVRNGLHLLVFGVVAVVFFKLLRIEGISSKKAACITILVLACVGLVSETLQYVLGRQPDILDVARDIAGAVLALVARAAWLRSVQDRGPRIAKLATCGISILVSVVIIAPLVFWTSIIGLGRMASPVILDFDQWWSEYLYYPINADITGSGRRTGTAEVLLRQSPRSGLIVSPMVTNWIDYDYLVITARISKGPDTNVTVRINDSDRKNSWSDQFLVSIVVGAKISRIRIPLDELIHEPGKLPMDLSDIQELVMFARDRRPDTALLIEEIRLE